MNIPRSDHRPIGSGTIHEYAHFVQVRSWSFRPLKATRIGVGALDGADRPYRPNVLGDRVP
jgi:hypothetical protein